MMLSVNDAHMLSRHSCHSAIPSYALESNYDLLSCHALFRLLGSPCTMPLCGWTAEQGAWLCACVCGGGGGQVYEKQEARVLDSQTRGVV
jgi:hypothetical protein